MGYSYSVYYTEGINMEKRSDWFILWFISPIFGMTWDGMISKITGYVGCWCQRQLKNNNKRSKNIKNFIILSTNGMFFKLIRKSY